ncbi:MAG: HPr family phosphocarrier protein [Spirochaetales bacterium]|nr:HPr family phosphocarrier protein [Spirochaetales bacterium]
MNKVKDMFNDDFEELIASHGEILFNLCQFSINDKNHEYIYNRKFLGRLNLEATWMEETLDAYGSQHNNDWARFREVIAAQKMFTSVCYDLLHLKHAVPHYNLISLENDFISEIEGVLEQLKTALLNISKEVIYCSKKKSLSYGSKELPRSIFDVKTLEGRLESNNKKAREISKNDKVLVYLATSFLNLSTDVDIIESGNCVKKKSYSECIPDHISEEKLRVVKASFHNLQSLYDTYLSKSNMENQNPDLKTLRGHISTIFHLLNMATQFSHYYERHIIDSRISLLKKPFLPLPVTTHLAILIEFFLRNADRYFTAAKDLCRQIISVYSEKSQIVVSIPKYRGFHVRPSTLIAKIVIHYGSDVTMELEGKKYDAASPMELFRVNEKLNAEKRRYINNLVCSEKLLKDLDDSNKEIWKQKAQLVILHLMDKDQIVLYEQNLSMDGNDPQEGETPEVFFKRIIALFLASGKIDIQREFTVKFLGDKRVLLDLRILAEKGYGEDKFGNNIMLPPELSYLRR